MRFFSLLLTWLVLSGTARAADSLAAAVLCETAIASAEYSGRLPPQIGRASCRERVYSSV